MSFDLQGKRSDVAWGSNILLKLCPNDPLCESEVICLGPPNLELYDAKWMRTMHGVK